MSAKAISRIIRKVEISHKTNCWVYTGTKDKNGYGRAFDSLTQDRRAHRIAYRFFVGEIPEGKMVCHTCDNPTCCNPSHLFLGTALDNNQDRERKGRGADKRGSNNPSSKLNDQQAQEIHSRYASGERMVDIAAVYGIGFQNVSLIVRGINRAESYIKFHGSPPPKLIAKPRLSGEQVSEIRNSTLSGVALASKFNMSTAQISRIKNGKRSGSK